MAGRNTIGLLSAASQTSTHTRCTCTLSWTAGDRKAGRSRERAWKDGGGEGGSKGGETSREVSCRGHWSVFIHKPSHNAALETLVLRMTNSVQSINNILCIVMRHSVLFDRWLT